MLRPLIATFLLFLVLAARIVVQAAPPLQEAALAPVAAQDVVTSCDALITKAMDTAGTACGALDRNQACYGNNLVQAQLQDNVSATFAKDGDIAPLLSLKRVITTPLNEENQTWGIAVFKAQANIPDTLPGQNVTFLLFGDTTVDNPTPDMRAVTISTGIGQLKCNNAPPSALLIQSPEGRKVAMNINGADVTLGSTIYLTSVINQKLTIATIEGSAGITAFGKTQTVLPGTQVELPLGNSIGAANGLAVIGPPSPPQPFDTTGLSRIPLQLLPRPVLLPISSTSAPTATATTEGTCTPRTDWTFTYTVVSGDSVSLISSLAGITIPELIQANCLPKNGLIIAGQKLVVPKTIPPHSVSPRVKATATTPPPADNNNPPPDNNPPPQSEPTGPNFRVDDDSLNQGECTTARWDSDNIKEIYFDNQGVTGHGSRQVCPQETSSYTLTVVWQDNSRHNYTVRVRVAPSVPSGPVCGNSVCESGETSTSCPADCPIIIY